MAIRPPIPLSSRHSEIRMTAEPPREGVRQDACSQPRCGVESWFSVPAAKTWRWVTRREYRVGQRVEAPPWFAGNDGYSHRLGCHFGRGGRQTTLDSGSAPAIAEAEFLSQYLGEQPEIKELKKRQAEIEVLQQRRLYLGKLIDRLDQYIPPDKPVSLSSPSGAAGAAAKPGGIKRY